MEEIHKLMRKVRAVLLVAVLCKQSVFTVRSQNFPRFSYSTVLYCTVVSRVCGFVVREEQLQWWYQLSTMSKLEKGENINEGVLERICLKMDCRIEDIMEILPDQQSEPQMSKQSEA